LSKYSLKLGISLVITHKTQKSDRKMFARNLVNGDPKFKGCDIGATTFVITILLSVSKLSKTIINVTTLSKTTLSIPMLSILTLSITTISVMALSMITISVMTLSITTLRVMTLSIPIFIHYKLLRTHKHIHSL
jgi:hypothetical protein